MPYLPNGFPASPLINKVNLILMCWLTAPRIVIDLVLHEQQIKLSLESFCCNTTWAPSPRLLLDNIPASLAVRQFLPESQVFLLFSTNQSSYFFFFFTPRLLLRGESGVVSRGENQRQQKSVIISNRWKRCSFLHCCLATHKSQTREVPDTTLPLGLNFVLANLIWTPPPKHTLIHTLLYFPLFSFLWRFD